MKRPGTILFLLLLTGFSSVAQVLKVRDNNMFISLPRDISDEALHGFLARYDLTRSGIWSLVKTGEEDSLTKDGWRVEKEEKKLLLTKPLTSVVYPAGKVIFSPVPTPENWREPGGNRIEYGINDFNDGKEFSRVKSIVHFHLRGFADAKKVRLAGNFTNWQFAAFPMMLTDSGWTVSVKLDPGQYYYKFIVGDGRWITDPENKLTENDGRGNTNSVYFMPNHTFQLKGYPDAKQVFLASSFANWSDNDIPLKKTSDGWEVEVFVQDGTYKYYFIVDGKELKRSDSDSFQIGKPYHFFLKGFENAQDVFVTGDFDEWSGEDIRMSKTKNGWEKQYTLGPGNYLYRYIIDGEWRTDPDNPLKVRDAEGNENSYLVVGGNYTFRLKGYIEAKDVRLTGDFTDYSPDGVMMEKTADGWQARVHLAKGKHKYKFIIDGKSKYDPANKDWESERHGETYSVIWIDPNQPQ